MNRIAALLVVVFFVMLAVAIGRPSKRLQLDIVQLVARSDALIIRQPLKPDIPVFFVDQIPADLRAHVVVVSAHSEPPAFAGIDGRNLASKILHLSPSLVVLSTCFGATDSLLGPLSDGDPLLVVGATTPVAARGLVFDPPFFDPALTFQERAIAVHQSHGPIERWRTSRDQLRQARRELETLSPSELSERLSNRHPNLVRIPLRGSANTILMLVEPERFRTPMSRQHLVSGWHF